jgi:hypothetical protein
MIKMKKLICSLVLASCGLFITGLIPIKVNAFGLTFTPASNNPPPQLPDPPPKEKYPPGDYPPPDPTKPMPAVPEPITMFGTATALGLGVLFKQKSSRKKKSQ